MKSNYSLTELKEIEKKLETSIKSDLKYLDEFQYYTIDKHSDIHFHIRGYFPKSLNIPLKTISIDDYEDKKTGESLTEKQIKNITEMIYKIEKQKKRLSEIKFAIAKSIYGDEILEKRVKNEILNNDKATQKECRAFILRQLKKNNCEKGKTVKEKILTQIMREAQRRGLSTNNNIDTWRKRVQRIGFKMAQSNDTHQKKDSPIGIVISNNKINKYSN